MTRSGSALATKRSLSGMVASTYTAVLCLCVLCQWSNTPLAAAFTAAPLKASKSRVASACVLEVSTSTPTTSGTGGGKGTSTTVNSSSSNQAPSSQPKPSKSLTQIEELLPWDWRNVAQEVWKLDMRSVILFDGDCNLCNGGVNMLLDMDTSSEFRFCSLSSKFGQSMLVAHGKDPDDRNSIIVISPKRMDSKAEKVGSTMLQKSEAVMKIASKLEGAPSWVKAMTAAGTVAPTVLSDWLLQIVADNRHRVAGEYDQCRLDFDGEYDGRFLNDYEHEELFVQ